jgi:hypothetical protein
MVDIVQGVKDFARGVGKADWFEFENTAGDVIEAYLPAGRLTSEGYKSPRELYGDGFMSGTPEQRRAYLKLLREREKAKDAIPEDEQNLATKAGEIVGTILKDPATLFIPAGKTVVAGAKSGFGVGVMFDTADQLANTGTIDPVQAGVAGGLGGVLGGTFNGVAAKLTKLGKKTQDATSSPAAVKLFNDKIDQVEEIDNILAASGVDPELRPAAVATELGVEEDLVRMWVAGSTRRLNSPDEITAQAIEQFAANPASVNSIVKFTEEVVTPIRRRIERISPRMGAKLQRYEAKLHMNKVAYEEKVTPFIQAFQKLPQVNKNQIALHLNNGNYEAAKSTAAKFGIKAEDVDAVQTTLQTIYKAKNARGIDTAQLEEYFPRIVKDWAGLRKSMGKEGSDIDKMRVHYAREKFGGKPVSSLTKSEDMWIMEQYMKGKSVELRGRQGSSRGNFDVRETQLDFYEDPSLALINYIGKAADDIAAADEIFGIGSKLTKKGNLKTKKTKIKDTDMEIEDLDLDENLNSLLYEMEGQDKLAADQVRELLKSRLNMTHEPTFAVVRGLRSLGYLNTIANPLSALTQLTDIGNSAVVNGIVPTLKALVKPKQVDTVALGLTKALDADYASVSTLSKLLEFTLKYSGFKSIDQLGKNTYLNAALNKSKAVLKTAKGRERLRKKWGVMFEDDVDNLLNDIEAGDVTERVKMMLFSELSESQPISMSEMPQKYLDHPNGRLMYMLKTFGLKQLDLMRTNIVDAAARGDTAHAAKFTAGYLGVVTTMGASMDEVKDWLRGGTPSLEDIPDNYIDKLWGLFFTSRYMGKDVLEGDALKAVSGLLVPPLDWINSVNEDITVNVPKVMANEARAKDINWATPGELPIMGQAVPHLFDYFLGQHNLREKKDKEIRERGESANARRVRRLTQ